MTVSSRLGNDRSVFSHWGRPHWSSTRADRSASQAAPLGGPALTSLRREQVRAEPLAVHERRNMRPVSRQARAAVHCGSRGGPSSSLLLQSARGGPLILHGHVHVRRWRPPICLFELKRPSRIPLTLHSLAGLACTECALRDEGQGPWRRPRPPQPSGSVSVALPHKLHHPPPAGRVRPPVPCSTTPWFP